MEKQLHSKALQTVQVKQLSVRDAKQKYIEYAINVANVAESTIPSWSTRLSQMIDYLESVGIYNISDVTNITLDDFFTSLRSHNKVSSINTTRRTIKTFFTWVSGYLEVDIRVRTNAIRLAKTPKPLPKAQDIDIIRRVIRETPNEQDSLMIAFMVESGLRISEIVRIRVEDLRYDEVSVWGKGNSEHIVNITDGLAARLKIFLEKSSHTYLFEQQAKGWHGKMTPGTARVRMQKAFMDVAGVHTWPHRMRHTKAVEMLVNGCDIMTVKEEMGHAYVSTTQQYLILTDKRRKQQVKKFMVSAI